MRSRLLTTGQPLLIFSVVFFLIGCNGTNQKHLQQQSVAADAQARLCGQRVDDTCKVAALETSQGKTLAIKNSQANDRLWALMLADEQLTSSVRNAGFNAMAISDGQYFWRKWNVSQRPRPAYALPPNSGGWSRANERDLVPAAKAIRPRTVFEAREQCSPTKAADIELDDAPFRAQAFVCPGGMNVVAIARTGDQSDTIRCLLDHFGLWTVTDLAVVDNSIEIKYTNGNGADIDFIHWNTHIHSLTLINFDKGGEVPLRCESFTTGDAK
jgi:hypothetical protein